jgi:regulatory protein
MPDTEKAQCLASALRLLARAEQCRAGLSLKLQKKQFPKAIINSVLDELEDSAYLDDARFARAWLSARVKRPGKPQSPRSLLAGLLRRGLNGNTAACAIAQNVDMEALARLYAEKNADLEEAELRRIMRREHFPQEWLPPFPAP